MGWDKIKNEKTSGNTLGQYMYGFKIKKPNKNLWKENNKIEGEKFMFSTIKFRWKVNQNWLLFY